MRKSILLIVLSLFLMVFATQNVSGQTIKGRHYELTIAKDQKVVLVLFPCFPCNIEHTKTEAGFLKGIEKKGVTTILLDYNQKLFLTESEKQEYAKSLHKIFKRNKISTDHTYIGGFSGGGNVALLLAAFLIKNHDPIQPKGLLVVDSPIDLEKLYANARKDVTKNADPDAVEEGKFLTELLEKEIGKPGMNREKYKTFSPYLMSASPDEGNIHYLKNIKTRFYCEPDLKWQLEKKNRTYEELNAYVLEKAVQTLQKEGSKHTELIQTRDRGIRADGTKHPHSWNIVDGNELVKWMME
ncbi:hypothetical protein B0A69_06185 [Chryseobacterium shigense]|uniref:Alpha/beta hydrolase fold n=1 Tax=Chryseobacterium shigense TaxID=297244 RepID=A0A1N7I4F5_9FLAO|nr:hypothetical protein [Chryseobacterium shigense]PQA95039.1 hypothetical protein B0A69_06185 [Chryseobacterium shigense]SIS31957.1 hypothetical protein SAMN05421639_1025 [Chryseobacterium shigense]